VFVKSLGRMSWQLYLHFPSWVCKKALLDGFAMCLSGLLCVCARWVWLDFLAAFLTLNTFFNLSENVTG